MMSLFLIAAMVCALPGDSAGITNLHGTERVRLAPAPTFLYEPGKDWTYSHHPSLAFFDGRYYAMWSNGRRDEDAPGQRVLYCTSADGEHWEPPRALLGPLQGEHSELVLTAAGFHAHAGTLVAYCGQYEYAQYYPDANRGKPGDSSHKRTGLLALTSTDGERWSAPIDMHLPVVPNHPPQPTRSGRLIISGNISYPYTDDPAGLKGWKMAGIYPLEMRDTVFDDSEGFLVVKDRMNWPAGLCEGSFYQTDDSRIHLLLRSGRDQLWVTDSADDGATWSAPQPTSFSDNAAKFHFGRLPDGRFYYVGNPDPDGNRLPLVLSLSEDGHRFDRHFILADTPREVKTPGRYKGGVYGYPHTLVRGDTMFIICSVCKEAIMVLRVPLSALGR